MADVITRLKLDSGEYDSKIKRATQGLLQMEEECRKVGGTLAVLEDEQKQYVQSLGQMDTVSRNVRGKLAELTAAYTELRVQYERLTEEEKQGDYGKALSSSLDQLKARIGETKSQLNEAGKEINNSGGLLDNLASKFVVNVDAMKLFNMGLSAAKGALNVAKDAFFASEANVDEWGRTVQSSHSLYEGFLNAINNGDISGYLSRINDIVTAAREAYDALDRLGTMRTIQAPQISAQQKENDRLRMMVQTGRYIGRISGRKETWEGNLLQNGQVLTKEQIQAFERKLNRGVENIVTLISNEVEQTTNSIDAIYRSQGKDLGLSVEEFRKGTSSMAEFDKRMKMYQRYVDWNAEAQRQFARQGGRGSVDFDKNNPFAAYRVWGNFRVDGERYNNLVQLIQQRDQQEAQAYGMQGQAYRTMNRAEGMTVRNIMNGGGGGGGTRGGRTTTVTEVLPVGSVAELTKQMQELQKAQQLVTNTDDWKNYQDQIDAVKKSIDKLKGITTVEDRYKQIVARDFLLGGYFSSDLNRQSVSDIAFGGVNLSTNISKRPSMQSNRESMTDVLNKISDTMSGTASSVGNIFSGVEQMGIDIPNEIKSVLGVVQGVATILTGISSLVTIIAGTSWLPFANGGVVHAAGGVIVPGNHRSGDMVPAMLNSGEVVLNAAQAANLSSILQSGVGENLNLTATISGEQIRLALNNNSRRRGRGEYVTSNTIR